jgi:hypothetical protein
MLKYRYKLKEELAWAALTATAIFLTETVALFKPEEISDPKTYALMAVGALVRTFAVALSTAIGKVLTAAGSSERRERPERRRSRPTRQPDEAPPPSVRGTDGPRD